MAVSFNCPKCSKTLQAEPSWSGQQTQCPFCKNNIIIPQFSQTQQPPPMMGTQIPPMMGTIPNNQSYTSTYPTPSANAFFLIRFFNSILNGLRSISFLSYFSSTKNIVAKTGAIFYLLLGLLLFIVACIRSANASSTWTEIFSGICLFIGTVVFTYVGMFMFQQYDVISSQTKEHSIPLAFSNVISIIALGSTLYFLVLGITETCTQDKGLSPLYANLRWVAFFFPIFIASLAPSNISISIKDSDPIASISGILHFSAKAILFAIPFVWTYDALYRMIHMLIHLGAEKYKFAEAFKLSSENLLSGMLTPVYFYVGYLLFNLIYTAIICRIENKKN